MRKVMCVVAVVAATCWPPSAMCDEHMMAVGFQFSASAPQGPTTLTDFARDGLHFRTFYEVMTISENWQVVGEFGYGDFSLRRGDYADFIRPTVMDSLDALFGLDVLPPGTVATLEGYSVEGGNFNAMHVTGGAKYLPFPEDGRRIRPYVMVQGGFYSTGQSDADIAGSFTVESSEDTLSWMPTVPFIREADRDNAFGLNFGGGAELSLTNTFSLVGDFRYHVAFTDDRKTTFVDLGVGIVHYLGF